MDLFSLLEIVLFTLSALGIYGWYFRIRWKMLIMGIPAIVGAYFIEIYFVQLSFIDMFVFLVVIAPIVEELLKFLCTFFGKDVRTATAVGLMFATVENLLYYISYSGIFLFVFSVREFTDPLLHMTTTSVSVQAWKKWKRRFYGIIIAVIMHSFWNWFSIQILGNSYMIYAVAIPYGVVLAWIVRRDRIKTRKEKSRINKEKNIEPLTEVSD